MYPGKEKHKKLVGSCPPSSGKGSNIVTTCRVTHPTSKDVTRIDKTKVVSQARTRHHHVDRYVYNSRVYSKEVKSLLVRPLKQSVSMFHACMNTNVGLLYSDVLKQGAKYGCAPKVVPQCDRNTSTQKQCKIQVENVCGSPLTRGAVDSNCSDREACTNSSGANNTLVDRHQVESNATLATNDIKKCDTTPSNDGDACLHMDSPTPYKRIYDCRQFADDKYFPSILYHTRPNKIRTSNAKVFQAWKSQSGFDFGFIPLTELVLPHQDSESEVMAMDPVELHQKVKRFGKPNFLGARIRVQTQLNVNAWEALLVDYWDRQLIEFLKFGFPLGFNRNASLSHDDTNHKSAIEYPEHVEAYLAEEISHGAIVGPFTDHPIANSHFSPFMTRPKANSDNRRVILDLSWPQGSSVNDGIEKDAYMGVDFNLTFPSLDHLTTQLTKLGKGAHIYKVDVSRAFRHLKVDPYDYDLLGLRWRDVTYVDTCVLFGSRQGSQNFKRTSDAVRYVNVDMTSLIILTITLATARPASPRLLMTPYLTLCVILVSLSVLRS